jgi:hypothetical protein
MINFKIFDKGVFIGTITLKSFGKTNTSSHQFSLVFSPQINAIFFHSFPSFIEEKRTKSFQK